MCEEPIASSGRRGPRRSICEKPGCRAAARAEAYIAAAIRELEGAGMGVYAGELRELLEEWRRDTAAIYSALREAHR